MKWLCLRYNGSQSRIIEAGSPRAAARRLPGGDLAWLIQPMTRLHDAYIPPQNVSCHAPLLGSRGLAGEEVLDL